MHRRAFLTATAAAMATTELVARKGQPASPKRTFKLKYGPHLGMFQNSAGKDYVDQLKFAADQGFTAWEDNSMKNRSPDLQEKVARAMQHLGIQMGVFVSTVDFQNVTFASEDKAVQEKILNDMRDSLDVAKRFQAKWTTVMMGCYDKKLAWDFQTANAIDLLKRCCDIVEPHGLVMVIEPLNERIDHPGVFLTRSPQAYMICKAVGRPSCKILFDIYHQQITEGNLLPNIARCWDEIGYFQIGDNPGRKEPGTGEINYRNIFRFIHGKGFQGVLGMEHGNAKPGVEGEQALIKAYVEADSF
jgi:hydroxypyruvate isomerase